jgi:predicted enzyme related to lactoylglutathione lyase
MPKATNGKICYVEIPAKDIKKSADFYAKVFGWKIKKRGDGSTAFDDPVGGVSGAWYSSARSRRNLACSSTAWSTAYPRRRKQLFGQAARS